MSQTTTYSLVVAGDGIYKDIACASVQELALQLQMSMLDEPDACVFECGGFVLLCPYRPCNQARSQWLCIRAFSAKGHLMHLPSLLGLAARLSQSGAGPSRYWRWRWGTWNGEGPVPGTACRRGGYGTFRNIQTHAQNRMHALVVQSDGEVAARAKRRKLPTAWDDFVRRSTPTWKDQRKGRKAWDR